jgi:MSHA biogenesis protein MshJ
MTPLWWKHPQVERALDAYRGLTEREQKLAVMTAHVIVGMLLIWIFLLPIWESAQAELKQKNELSAVNQRQQAHLERLQNSPVIDLNQPIRNELAEFQQQQSRLDSRIGALTNSLVSPEHMVTVLEQLLMQDKRLRLISLKNLPQTDVDLGEEYADVERYRHGVRVKMTATYDSLVAYLKRLDSLPWKVYWQALEYRVDEYPNGELVLEIFTISTREDMLGV